VRAIDTNVIVRFLTGDDAAQFRRARAVIEGGAIFIATTVLLESEWVLRSAYRFSAARIAASLRGIAGLPGVTLEEPALLAGALDALEAGMDFADALHLGKAQDCSAFLSFDRELIKAAARHSALPVEQP
jgi:predicted nucleic-acid-binding protein